MSEAYKCLSRELDKRERFNDEINEREMNRILTCRDRLYKAIESLDNYEELMEENMNFKTTGNLYSVKGIDFFDEHIQALAKVYEKSKEKYITSNIGIIIEQINFKDTFDYLDRFQEAAIYFQRSFNHYDETKCKFVTYAYSYVKYGILNSYNKDNIFVVRDSTRFLSNRIKKMKNEYGDNNLSISDIKDEYPDYTYEEIQEAIMFNEPVISLHTKITSTLDGTPIDLIEAVEETTTVDEEIDNLYLIREVERAIKNAAQFTDRDRKILTMRFGLGLPDEYTLEEVGKQFGITKERVRQLERKALDMLKNKYGKKLKHFY